MTLNFTASELTPQVKALIGLTVVNLCLTLDFAERDKILITDAASLLTLKQILEETYTDGITAIKEVYLEGDRFTGIFEDKVSDKLTKRNRFTLSENEVSYKLENPEAVNDFSEDTLAFAVKGAKNCVKGQSCGGSCISKSKTCKKVPSAGARKKVETLKTKVKGGSEESKAGEAKKTTTESKKSTKTNGLEATSTAKKSKSPGEQMPKSKKVETGTKTKKQSVNEAIDESLSDMKKMSNSTDNKERTTYAIFVGGATDRVEALRRVNFESPQWKNDPEYQKNAVSEAAKKLSYNDDSDKRNQRNKKIAEVQGHKISDLERIDNFNKNSLNLVRDAYAKISNDAKKLWAKDEYIGFFNNTSPDGVDKRKVESYASKSSTHAEIAKDLEARIKKMVDSGELKVLT